MSKKLFRTTLHFKQAPAEEGEFIARISVFNEIDSDGDVVLPTFFTDGQEIPIAAWGHNWGALSVGKGIVRVTKEAAELHGRFFTETQAGKEHYLTVKAMGDLQEWSFGFDILKAYPDTLNGTPAQFLERGDIFEGSPVLVGANRNTGTVAIKGAQVQTKGAEAGSYEERIERVQAALRDYFAAQKMAVYVSSHATYADRVIALQYDWMKDEETFWQMSYTIDVDGTIAFGEAEKLERVFVSAEKGRAVDAWLDRMGLDRTVFKGTQPFAEQIEAVLAAASAVKGRTRSLADLRRKEGRAISSARRERLGKFPSQLREIADDIDGLLEETAPPEKGVSGFLAAALAMRADLVRSDVEVA